MKEPRLKIALQKKGRLHNDCINLLSQCGLKIRIKENSLVCHCDNLPVDLLFIRDDDIPTLVSDNVCDMGVIGENVLIEEQLSRKKQMAIEVIKKLGLSQCRLSIAVPSQQFTYKNLQSLKNCRIATSHPNLLQNFLLKNNIDAKVIVITGSVEIAPRISMADAICDLVATGVTLEENHLEEVETILESQAVLIKSMQKLSPEKQTICELLLGRIHGVIQAQGSKYIMFHAPKSSLSLIKSCLPGCETPTIVSLNGIKGKVAVHVVSREGVFWSTLEKLKEIGASSILVMPIEKMLN